MITVTPIYAGLLGLFYIVLASNVIRTRHTTGVNLGHGDEPLLERRIRAHGNFAEYAPIALLLIALAEAGGVADWAIHALGVALLLGRGMHGYALSSLTLRPIARTAGMAITLTVIGFAAAACLTVAISS
ncbi:MAG: MAPEG family protein [Alphaproteobacteria bacterium]|nr:MAPEG family protein [Alphaproteobacteria bacterium]